ncbi:hypothetical protein DEDGFLLK_00063 [Lactiplantibacillus phage Gut-P1]|nr:hypothetical protein DEDGFLLK_00063 [Lactiplantibacillus phage Gut-P1]
MLSVGDLVRVKSTNIYGVVVGYTNVFDVCQETDDMLIVSINNSEESKMFKRDSIEKINNE